MTKRIAIAEIAAFDDVADVPAGVELCSNDKCPELGLHAAHEVRVRGAVSKTYTCKACTRSVRLGLVCPCRSGDLT